MPTFTSSREATKDEMAREIDRCHKVISELEARAEAAEAVWLDPIALHANLLRTGVLTREQALHLAGATDYDTLKARAEAAEAARDQWRENWSTYRKAWAAMLPNPGRWPDDANEASDVCDAYAIENQQLFDRIADLEARLVEEVAARAKAEGRNDVLENALKATEVHNARVPDREAVALEALHDVLASLVAATSLAKRAEKAAPSDTMHAMMIADYEKSAERGRAALQAFSDATNKLEA